jgi:hypothetical protein
MICKRFHHGIFNIISNSDATYMSTSNPIIISGQRSKVQICVELTSYTASVASFHAKAVEDSKNITAW